MNNLYACLLRSPRGAKLMSHAAFVVAGVDYVKGTVHVALSQAFDPSAAAYMRPHNTVH